MKKLDFDKVLFDRKAYSFFTEFFFSILDGNFISEV